MGVLQKSLAKDIRLSSHSSAKSLLIGPGLGKNKMFFQATAGKADMSPLSASGFTLSHVTHDPISNRTQLDVSDSDDEGVIEDWEEGRTLVDGMKNLFDEESELGLEDALATVDELQGPMSEQSKKLQQELVDTLVPAMDHIRLVHGLLQDSVEQKYMVVNFNNSADELQVKVAKDKETLAEMLEASKATLRTQFAILQAEYDNRRRMYSTLRAKVQEILTPAREVLDQSCPEKIEEVKEELLKRSKVLGRTDKTGQGQENLLKTLLGKK